MRKERVHSLMLMSVDTLATRLHEKNIVIFDCRFQLSDPEWGDTQYLQGHIPGAFYLNLDKDLAAPVRDHGGRHPLPDAKQLAGKLGTFGVGAESTVVVYDSGEGMATRAWWLIRYLGHEHVYVLDGGYKAWLQFCGQISTDIPVAEQVEFPLHIHVDWVVDYETVSQISQRQMAGQLIDARAPERFRGEKEPIDPEAGHIPSAQNAPWTEGVGANGQWKEAAEQRDRFEAVKSGDGPIVVYCGSGVTACGTLFAMSLAGIDDAKLYAGSWSDWVSYADSLVETGGTRQ